MARVAITEFRAKKLILGDEYRGLALGGKAALPRAGRWVVKVDEGVKGRFKKGLVAIDVSGREVPAVLARFKKKGFSRFLAEPFFPHGAGEERYLSFERVRGGIRVLSAREGGVDVEKHPEKIKAYPYMGTEKELDSLARETGIPKTFLKKLLEAFEKNYFAFLEINPLVVRGGEAFLLDAAAMVDSAGAFFVGGAWSEDDVVEARGKHPAERAVRALQKTTPASLKLTVVNPDGALFFLLSGGGGSIVIADEAQLKGAGKEIGNYGEYSGNPSREETHLYTREVLRLLLASRAKKKALVVAGGVANFTDIKATFAGVVDALLEAAPRLKKAGVRVFIRRGGPNEAVGLFHMKAFLSKEGLLGSIHGSDAPITAAVDEAVHFVRV